MARSPLTETIKRVNGMVHYVQENLSADEYMLFLDLCVPEPEAVKPAKKKPRKPRGKSAKGDGYGGDAEQEPVSTAERGAQRHHWRERGSVTSATMRAML